MAWMTIDVSGHQIGNALFDNADLFVEAIEEAAYRHNDDGIRDQTSFLEEVAEELSDTGMNFLRDLVVALEKTREAL